MSNIIKACFVVNDKRTSLEYPRNHRREPALGPGYEPAPLPEEEPLTQETADSIYEETKSAIEELILAAQKRAESIISHAQEEARGYLENSQKEAEEIREAAYQKGYKLGYQKGIAIEKEFQSIYQQVSSVLEKIKEQQALTLKNQEKDIIELVMLLTEKIIGTIVEVRPEIISNIIKNTLEEVKDTENVVLKVNPVHLPYLTPFNERFTEVYSGNLLIIDDPNMEPGDCLVSTENGFIEAKINEQLALLRQGLLEVSGHAGI